jgi:hypothetical protein
MAKRFGDRAAFAVEVGPSEPSGLRIVDLWAADSLLTTDDSAAYVPSLSPFLRASAAQGGPMSFGALVPCAQEAGIRPGVAHGQVRIGAWGHRPNPALAGHDLLGTETSSLLDLGFETTAPAAVHQPLRPERPASRRGRPPDRARSSNCLGRCNPGLDRKPATGLVIDNLGRARHDERARDPDHVRYADHNAEQIARLLSVQESPPYLAGHPGTHRPPDTLAAGVLFFQNVFAG